MSSQKNTRLQRELAMFSDSPPFGISCWSKEGSLHHLEAQIIGSDASPYADGVFKLQITVPDRYPFEPPNIQFITPIYHPNIDISGRICLDSLKMPPKGSWSPALNICTLLTTIQLLMSEPNPDDPLMTDIANEFKYNRLKYEETARDWTKRHARDTSTNVTANALCESKRHHPNTTTARYTTTKTTSATNAANANGSGSSDRGADVSTASANKRSSSSEDPKQYSADTQVKRAKLL